MAVEFKIEVEDDRKKWDAIARALGESGDLAVAWGIFKGAIARYAIHNEYGAPNANIPERPFMRTSVDQNQDQYVALLESAFSRLLDGNGQGLEDGLNQIGIRGRNHMIESIMDGGWAPNTEATVQSKKSSRPLVDTGAMRNAIEWAIGKFARFK